MQWGFVLLASYFANRKEKHNIRQGHGPNDKSCRLAAQTGSGGTINAPEPLRNQTFFQFLGCTADAFAVQDRYRVAEVK